MPLFFLKSQPTTDPTSGLTGSPEISEPAATRPQRIGLRTRLRNARVSASGTVRGLPRVLVLVWRASPGLTLGLAVATVVAGLVPVATAATTRMLVNSVTNAIRVRTDRLPDHGVLGPIAGVALHTTATGAILAAILVQFIILALNAGAGSMRGIATQLLQARVSQHIEAQVMEHASRLDLAFFEESGSYDLIRQAREEASSRPVAMISNVFGALQCGVTFASLVVLLAALNPWVAVAALLAPVPAFIADSRFGKAGFMMAVWSSPIRRRMQYLSTLVTTDSFAKEVKLFGLGPYLVRRYRALGDVYYRRQRRQITSRSLAGAGFGAITTLVGSLTFLYVALLAVGGRLTIGDLVMYTAAAAALQSAVFTTFQELAGVYEDNLYLDTLYRMLATDPLIGCPPEPVPLPATVSGRIVFEHVTFRYPGADSAALDDVSFEIPPGRTFAVVGRNGAGKSTLVKLACRLYDPTAGRILLDGVDLRDFDPDVLHRTVSAMFQDYVTYQATAAENVALGDVDHVDDRERVETAAVRGGAHDLIAGMPFGYDTPLGKWFDKGINLSGGEWQKVALSRAFMRDAPILLLDEPTSALDPASEHELFQRLRVLAAGRTTIYISHRFSTVRRADRILLLSGGRVTEQGTHAELIGQDQEYAELFRLNAQAYVDDPAPPRRNGTMLTKADR